MVPKVETATATRSMFAAPQRGSFAMPNDETGATPIQDTLELMTAASIENCRLDARELMLVGWRRWSQSTRLRRRM